MRRTDHILLHEYVILMKPIVNYAARFNNKKTSMRIEAPPNGLMRITTCISRPMSSLKMLSAGKSGAGRPIGVVFEVSRCRRRNFNQAGTVQHMHQGQTLEIAKA